MASEIFKQRCIELRKQGLTLAEIMKATGRPKTTVYHHIQNIPLSAEKVVAIRKLSYARISHFGPSWKGKSRLYRHPKFFDSWTPDLVLLIAHLMFDGTLRRTGCGYNNRSEVLITRVCKLMKKVYDFSPARYNGSGGVIKIEYSNVELGIYVLTKTQELREKITDMSTECHMAFLRAFFDDEGCVSYNVRRHSRQVRGYQYDAEMLRIIQTLLSNFGIESVVSERFNQILIRGKRDLQLFADKLNFTPGLCVNGNRSNSV